jgi:putative sigma-54 modulation protein
MRLVLTGRHVDISPGLRQLVDKKLVRIERLLGDTVVSAQVKLTLEKARHSADITLHARGDHMLNGRATAATWATALSGATEKIQSQATTLKGKWAGRKRRGAPPRVGSPASAAKPQAAASARLPRIVRLTRGQFKPMSIESAAIELAASGDAFLLFRNLETDGLNVLVRQAGDFGLVEAER